MAKHRKTGDTMKNNSPVIDVNELQYLPVLMDTQQTARLMGCSDKYVRDMLAAGAIRGVKVGGKWFVNRDALLDQLGLVSANV